MTWVSRQLSEGRDAHDFSNYGEKLYSEGLHEIEKRKALVGAYKASNEQDKILRMLGKMSTLYAVDQLGVCDRVRAESIPRVCLPKLCSQLRMSAAAACLSAGTEGTG